MKKLVLIAVIAAFAALLPASGASAAPAQERVIAQLNLADGASPEQIAAATDALLAQLPAGSYAVNNRYSTLPYVALSAGPQALSVLRQSGLVVAVYDDGVVSAATASKTKNPKTKNPKSKKCKRGKKAKKTCKKHRTTKNSVS